MSKKKTSKKQKAKAPVKKAPPPYGKFAIWGVLAITVITFLPINNAEFVNWDDKEYVLENPYIQNLGIENIKTFFLSGIHPDYPSGIASNYHPLTMLSLAFNYSMTQLDASSYHWTNLLIHLLNVFLVYLFLGLFFGKKNSLLMTFGALLFAIHPMHVESVAWVSERKDVLFTFFFLLGLISYIKSKQGLKFQTLLVYLFFILSLLSKPSAVIFPLILVLMDWFYDKKFNLKNLLYKIPFFIISVIFGLITINIQTEAIGDAEAYSLIQRFSFGSFGTMYYIKNFFLPINPATFFPYPYANNIPTFILLAPLGFLLTIAGVLFIDRKSKVLLFGFGFFFINLLLTLQFFQVGASLVSDRYTYLAYLGLIIILLHFLDKYFFKANAKFFNSRYIIIAILGLWSCALAVKSYQQTKTWENGKTLWQHVINKFPASSFANKAISENYMDEEDYETAITYLDIAKKSKQSFEILNKRGNTLRHLKRYDEALEDLSAAIKLNPSKSEAFNNRANVYVELKKLDLALKDYEKCIALDPENPDGHGNLGAYYFTSKQYDKALIQYDKYIELSTDKSIGYLNKAAVNLNTFDYKACLDNLNNYISSGGEINGNYHFYKALSLEKTGQLSAALKEINSALSFKNGDKNYLSTKQRIENALK